MSEQILDRTTRTGRAPAAVDTPAAAASGRNRTFLLVAAAIIAGLVLGGLALMVLRPSSGDDLATGPVAPQQGASAGGVGAAADPAADPADSPPAAAPSKATVKMTSRDPFAPLVPKKVAPAPKPADTASGGTSAASTSSDASTTPAAGATISALKISPLGNSATLKLDGKKYEVDEGETFASSYRLYDIFNANCAGFLYGDQNAVVCEGDSVQIG